MNTTRTAVAVSALLVATGLAAVTTAAAAPSAPSPVSSSSTASAEDQLTAVATPLLSQQADGYQGKWAIEGDTLEESFEQDGVVVSTGTTSLRDGLAADEVVSFGYVAGFGDPDTGAQHAQLSGQAGADVWTAGDSADEYGPAVLQVDTPSGTATVSTDEVDVIAAEQRAADQG
jgi:type II secretory pathway pseudopilin PulG